jgi:hypothetical protein
MMLVEQPWYWVPAMFFIQHHQWQTLRMKLVPEESHAWFIVSRLAMLPTIYYIFQHWLLPRLYSGREMARRRQAGYGVMKAALTAVGPDWLGLFGGITVSWASAQLLYLTISNTVPAMYAWPTLFLYHILFYYMATKLIEAFTSPTAATIVLANTMNSTTGTTATSSTHTHIHTSHSVISSNDDPSNTTVSIWWYQWPMAAEIGTYMLMQLTYTGQGFPLKMVIYYTLLMISSIVHVNVARRFLRVFDIHRLPA